MNQMCKVCGEPAAGFHFGAFTCEGCKSFFGRSYNNLSSISECKNGGQCVINKKNRTSCKACRLRKCLEVGMSKSGSRYGRRSNWFKIHCLLQEQASARGLRATRDEQSPPSPPPTMVDLHNHLSASRMHRLCDTPSVSSSPESLPSESSMEHHQLHQPTPPRPHDLFLPFLPLLMGVSPPPPPPALMAHHLAAALASHRPLFRPTAWPMEQPDAPRPPPQHESHSEDEAIDLSVKSSHRVQKNMKEEEDDVTKESKALTPPSTPLDLSRVEV